MFLPVLAARGNEVQRTHEAKPKDHNAPRAQPPCTTQEGISAQTHLALFPEESWLLAWQSTESITPCLNSQQSILENVDVLSACLIIEDNSIL